MKKRHSLISLDVLMPVSNDEKILPSLIRLIKKIRRISRKEVNINFIFINDGSKDKSLLLIYQQAQRHKYIKIVNLSRNYGYQKSINAGIDFSEADYVVIMDADLANPMEVVLEMYRKAVSSNCDVVYGQPISQKKRPVLKKLVENLIYGGLSRLTGLKIENNESEFKLISRRVIEATKELKDQNRLLKGVIHWVGFKSDYVYFKNDSKYDKFSGLDIGQIVKNASETMFSFSNAPLRFSVIIGGIIVLFGLAGGLIMLYLKLFTPYTIPGITAVILSVVIMGGVQIMMLGVLAKYVSKMFEESRNLPPYLVNGVKNLNSENQPLLLLENEAIFGKEEHFHDGWANSIDTDNVLVDEFFEACTCPENRFIIQKLGDLTGKKVLEIGCGLGEASVYLAKKGAVVTATDVSGDMLELVKKVALKHKVKVATAKCVSHQIPFDDGTFDIVYAANVLHHVDLEPTLKEINRVLKKGGVLASWDPLAHNPAINIYRKMAMEVRTDDEHPIKMSQLKTITKYFPKTEIKTTWLLTLWIFLKFYFIDRIDPNKERYWKKVIKDSQILEKEYNFLEKLDNILLRFIPWLRRYCWNITVIGKK